MNKRDLIETAVLGVLGFGSLFALLVVSLINVL